MLKEFKKFALKGNVVDMAVGVIVGGAFTGVVNGLSNYILKPIINWILSLMLPGEGLEAAITFFPNCKAYKMVEVVDELGQIVYEADGITPKLQQVVDLANSIYIDWGSFISAIINFLLIAVVLFSIVKIINTVREKHDKMASFVVNGKVTKEEKAEMKASGLDFRSEADVEAFRERKAKEAEDAKKAADEAAALERLNNPTTEDLLKKICTILENK